MSKEEPFLCYYSDDLFNEIKRLRAMSLAKNHDGVGLSTIQRDFKNKNHQFDLKRFFYITKRGTEYLSLRSELMQDASESQ